MSSDRIPKVVLRWTQTGKEPGQKEQNNGERAGGVGSNAPINVKPQGGGGGGGGGWGRATHGKLTELAFPRVGNLPPSWKTERNWK